MQERALLAACARGPSAMTADTPHPLAVVVVKIVHTAVFLVELASILWLVASGLLGRRDRSVAAAGGLVSIEAAVFLANGGVCPLTPLSEHLGAARGSVSDIFLPERVARTIPTWSSGLVAFGVLLHARAAISRWTVRSQGGCPARGVPREEEAR